MAALTGNKIKDSYLGLLKSIGNGAISSSFVQISDGGGNALPLYLSTSSINFYNAYTFPSADGTVSGQVLSTDANGTLSWITSSDNQTLEEVLTQGNTTTIAISSSADITTTAQFNGDINGALLQKVKAAEVLSKGDVVYISGGTGDNPEVSKAKADSSTTMPALGIMKESLNNINDEGECITSGELTGVDLTGFSTGDELFVSSTTAGGLVDTAPTGEANLIQKIGKVIKGGNGGALTVLGAFRTNAMPNLPTGIILGDTTNVVTAITDGSVGQILSTDGNGTYSFIDDNAITSAVSPLNLSANQISLGTVGVSKGGTGATTLTGILLGNGTSAISGITSAVDGNVLTADGNGGYAFEVASGDVSISGTPTANQVAIWTDGSTIKGMSALEIDTNNKITLDQDASSYNIGGGNTANVTGNYNTGFGLDNLLSVTTGTRNVAFGYNSLKDLTIGTDNVAIGYLALQDVTEAIKCIAVGTEALSSVTTGHFNVAVGHTAGAYVSTSTRNTLVGYGSGSQLDTTGTPSGGYNTFIGYQAGSNVTTGSKNVVIGSNTNFVDGLNNYIVLSDGDGNLRMYLDNNGQLNLFSEISLRDSSATNNPLMFTIQKGTYTASSPYNTNKLIASNNSNISFQTTGSTDALFIEGTTGDVGIGITPTSKLTLLGTSTAASNTPSDAIVDIRGTSTAHLLMGVANVSPYGAWINTDSTTQPLILMGTGGNVGIGGTPPSLTGYTALSINNATNGAILDLEQGDVMRARFIATSTTATIETGSGIPFAIDVNGNGSSDLSISSGGAATFSGSSGDISANISNGNLIRLDGGSITTAGYGVGIRFERTGSQMGFIASGRENTSDEACFLSFATQASNGTHPEAMRISSGGDVRINNLIKFVDPTAGSAGTPQFKTLLSYQFSTVNALSTIKGGNEAGGTNGTYLKFSVNSSAAVNTPIDILTLKSAYVGGTTAQFDALIKANNGISFPNQSASSGTSTSETLDAYEEGSWTPVVKFGTTINSAGTTQAVYTRIGRMVYIQCTIQSITLSGSGNLSIEGLPYNVGAATTFGDTQGNFRWAGIALSGAATHISSYFVQGTSKMAPQIIGTSGFITTVTHSGVSSTWNIYGISGFYMI